MNLLYIILYFVIGYISALIYYIRSDEVDEKLIIDKSQKAVVVFFLWPIIIIGTLLLLPFLIHDGEKKKRSGN